MIKLVALEINTLTNESSVKLKNWNIIATIKKTIPTTIPNDSGLYKDEQKVIKSNPILYTPNLFKPSTHTQNSDATEIKSNPILYRTSIRH